MVRVKMPLRQIEEEKHRNSTFMKRRTGIKKKAMELEKLCGVETTLIFYGPRGQLETWPEDSSEVRRMVNQFLGLHPDDRTKISHDLCSFFDSHLNKLHSQLRKERDSWLNAVSHQEVLQSIDVALQRIDDKISRLQFEEHERERSETVQMEMAALESLVALPQLPPVDQYLYDMQDFSAVMDPWMGYPSSLCHVLDPMESFSAEPAGREPFGYDRFFGGGGGAFWNGASSATTPNPTSNACGDAADAAVYESGEQGEPWEFRAAGGRRL